MNQAAKELVEAMRKMPIVDAHSHLHTEAEAVGQEADLFTRIFYHYSMTNLDTAGFPHHRDWLKDTTIPLETRWEAFKPYFPLVRETGYFRAGILTARELYGVEDINDSTYRTLSERLQQENIPGLYDRVLKGSCNIKRILNQGTWKDEGKDGYALSVYRGFILLYHKEGKQAMEQEYAAMKEAHGAAASDAEEFFQCWFNRIVGQDYIGVKFHADFPREFPDRKEAEAAFRKLRQGTFDESDSRSLGLWIAHRAIEEAGQRGLVVAVHCGIIWRCGEDFYQNDPRNFMPILLAYPNTRFDLYHAGIPWTREVGVIANQCPHVYLNLVWCHQISPFMTVNLLNEWMDIVPLNKIIGFGGDLHYPEKTYGTLVLAMENIAEALALRMQRTGMSLSHAADICRMWLYENPLSLYNVKE